MIRSQNKALRCGKDIGSIVWVPSWLKDNWLSSAVVVRITTSGALAQLSHSWCEFQFPCPCHYLQHPSCLVRRTWGILWILGVGHPKSIYVGALPPLPGLVELVSGIFNLRFSSRFFSIVDLRFAIIIDCCRLYISILLLLALLSSSAVNAYVVWIIGWEI